MTTSKPYISIVIFSLFVHLHVAAQQFKISYTSGAFKGPFTGKVFIYMSKDNKEPKDGAVTIAVFPCMSIDVKNVKPGEWVMVDDMASSFPVKLSDIERGEYYVQAVWDRNLGGRSIAESPGNMFSKTEKLLITKNYKKIFSIVCGIAIPEPVFKETEFVKELKVQSDLLSDFHHKPMTVDAAVLLPAGYYKEPERKYPLLFLVSGYGGDYHAFSGDTTTRGRVLDSIPFITVFLDGNCSLGHSVYANSENNGPWGDALVKEFIPQVESRYRANGARLLTGHSSGGWTVLWLQTQYPSTFAGCWSSSPDPVDFRDYQAINLYEGENLIYDKEGELRNVATVAGRFRWATTKDAYRMERVIYRGEQMHSFDAVFSAKGADGNPARICDPETGAMIPATFEHWKKYDISLILRSNWSSLQKDLEGKIRVSIGEQDNFLLQGAVHLLDKEMKNLNAGMQFEYFPGDHFTVFTPEYRQKGSKFLADRYRQWASVNRKGF